MTRRWLALVALLALAFSFGKVRAAPLDAATCGMLKGEKAQLEQAGVRVSMAHGPDWAKANLGADKLEQIRRLLQLDEQLLFRCSAKALVELPEEAEADPAKAQKGQDEPEPASREPAPSAKKAPAAKPPASAARKAPAKAPDSPAAKPKPKPKPKAKVDDAYRQPPPDPKIDPFATQVIK